MGNEPRRWILPSIVLTQRDGTRCRPTNTLSRPMMRFCLYFCVACPSYIDVKLSSPRAEAKHRGQRRKTFRVCARYLLSTIYVQQPCRRPARPHNIPPRTTPCTTSPLPTPVPRFPCQPPTPSTPCTPSLSLTPVPPRRTSRTDFPAAAAVAPPTWSDGGGVAVADSILLPSTLPPPLPSPLTVAAEGDGGCGGGGALRS